MGGEKMDRSVSRFLIPLFCWLPFTASTEAKKTNDSFDLRLVETPRILSKAKGYLRELPRTVTADTCERSSGDRHDFYSEGDYWWPNPENPEGPYIRRDGETNPANFIAHRKSMIRLSELIGTLVSAYLLTGEEKYARPAVRHLRAWFVEDDTKMRPSLLYGQAIKGKYTGRSIGIIDTLHLVEVARGAKLLKDSPSFIPVDQQAVRAWFSEYLNWINTHEYGLKEKVHPNNHGVCWSLQAAAFADLTGNEEIIDWIRTQFKSVYLPVMMDEQGGFPAELKRTKPYGYSLFMIDVMAGVAQIVSTKDEDLWQFVTPNGRGMKKGMEFIFPYIVDKEKWPYEPDVMYWEEWPVRHPGLLFSGMRMNQIAYLKVWEKLEPDPKTYEVLRNLPLRHPLLWVSYLGNE